MNIDINNNLIDILTTDEELEINSLADTLGLEIEDTGLDIEFTKTELDLESGASYVFEKDHNLLDNRDLDDQHPISAITGLTEALDHAEDVEDVTVNGASVVVDKVAEVIVPTKLSELENDIEETDPIYTADKPNIALKSEIPAEQIQSDLAQEDDTQVDYVKNKHADYIKATLYEEDEEGEQILIYEGTVEEVLNLYLSMINETYESLSDQIDRKQDSIKDIAIMINRSQWRNNEVIIYTSDVTPESKLWYSPTNESYNDFVEAEIRMTEQGYGYVKFKCETTPEEDINIIIRRA